MSKINFRNRYAVITVRTLLGLMFAFSGFGGLMAGLNGMQGVPEAMMANTQMMWNTGIFQMIKVTEIVAGLMLVFGFLPALAAIFLAPVCVGILIFTALIAPDNMITGILVTAANAYLGYAYFEVYKPLFKKYKI